MNENHPNRADENPATNGDGAAPTNGDELVVAHPEGDKDRETLAVDTEMPPRLPFPVVGIGASAGGLEAITEFISAMRSDSGMAFVFIQHLPPDRESLMADILARKTKMLVQQVENGMEVKPDHVYVIRPGHILTIKEGRFHLGEQLGRRGTTRPVDDFFKSLAEEQRERSIAIILSGMGSNGTAGMQMVKAVGGLCIAQDPETAEFPSMPRHMISQGYADYILRPSDMPEILLQYANHPYAKQNRKEQLESVRTSANQLREILAILRTRTRQDFSGYKKPTILRRVQRRMGLTRTIELGEYAKVLRQSPSEVTALADDLLIHVTGFFRDAHAWEALRERVVAPLIAQREAESEVRAWVAACSSGEEAYTLAILLIEEAERARKPLAVKIFATDMAERSLGHARAGIYPGGIESEISPERLERFFDKDDGMYRIKQVLRESVVFAPQNVLQDPPFSRLDIATCRNLLIYLEPELQHRVLSLLHFGLREGGTLFLGTSETLGMAEELFEPIDKGARIFRRVGPTRHGSIDFPMPHARRTHGESGIAGNENGSGASVARSSGPGRQTSTRLSLAAITHRTLLEHHTPAAVTVDRDHRVLYYYGNTRPFLEQPAGEPTRDLMSLTREGVRAAVRMALQQAASTNDKAVILDRWIEVGDDRRSRIAVTASPIVVNEFGPDYFVVSFELREETPSIAAIAEDEASATSPIAARELRRMREELQSTIEELQTSNEELKASHEEVTSMNEELQSSNEELETSKEEMQSLNEELTTVNAQLQAKMEEHQEARNDLTALLASTDIAVLFLDRGFRIRRYTPPVLELIDLIAGDLGRPLVDLHRKFEDPELDRDIRRVLEKLVPVEHEVTAENGRSYARKVLPYRTVDNRIDGVVLTFVDVSERKRIVKQVAEAKEYAEAIVDTMHEPLLVLDADLTVKSANDAFYKHFKVTASQTLGRMIYSLGNGQWNIPALRTFLEDVLPNNKHFDDYEVTHTFEELGECTMLVNARRLDHVQYILLGIRDVTADRMARMSLRADTAEQFGLLVDGVRDYAMITQDVNGIITSWNVGAERVLGFTEEEAIGRPGAIIFTPEDLANRAPEAEMTTAASRGRAEDERWHLRKDGSRFWGSGVMTALRNPDGSVRAFVKVMRDQTERKQAEEELREAKDTAERSNRLKDDFLATLSHELRTPLSAIMIWTKLLQAPTLAPEQAREGLEAIIQSAESQKQLIDDLLDSSRITSGKLRLEMSDFELDELVGSAVDAIEPTAGAKDITIKRSFVGNCGIIRADADRMRQIVWNLLTNAVKFTPNGGKITVGCRRLDAYDVEVCVSDTGRGIASEFLPHVFERFSQSDPAMTRTSGGLGLGLAIVKQLVELHGGTIVAESDGVGKGAAFRVTLPLRAVPARLAKRRRKPEEAPAMQHAPPVEPRLRGNRVLVVEDQPSARLAVRTLLEAAGATVVDVEDASDALLKIAAAQFDVIVSDIGLPGTDGHALIGMIRERQAAAGQKRTPAIALTAFAGQDDERAALAAGFDRYLSKPFSIDQLLATVEELL